MKKKHVTLVMAILCVMALFVGSLAYFTDRVQAQATATAGTLDLDLSAITTSKTEKFKPSEGITIDFTLTNKGNKSADVKEMLVLTSSVAMTNGAVPAEFELYQATDVDVNANGIATVHAGANPVAVRSMSEDKKQITYTIPEFILNGTGTAAETETGITTNYKTSHYVLVFKAAAGNAYQNVTLKLDYLAQAKQHRNTDSTTWTTVQSQNITFAGNGTAVVPALT